MRHISLVRRRCLMKQLFTEGAVLDAALDIVREKGHEAVSMRSVAERAGCSVQPLYSMFGDKDSFMSALYGYGLKWVESYNVAHAQDASNAFAANGLAHIRIAQTEPRLFAFLYLSSFVEVSSMDGLLSIAAQPGVEEEIMARWDLSAEDARSFYLDMVIYTHGLATLLVAGAQLTDAALTERMNGAFRAFAARYGIDVERGSL